MLGINLNLRSSKLEQDSVVQDLARSKGYPNDIWRIQTKIKTLQPVIASKLIPGSPSLLIQLLQVRPPLTGLYPWQWHWNPSIIRKVAVIKQNVLPNKRKKLYTLEFLKNVRIGAIIVEFSRKFCIVLATKETRVV